MLRLVWRCCHEGQRKARALLLLASLRIPQILSCGNFVDEPALGIASNFESQTVTVPAFHFVSISCCSNPAAQTPASRNLCYNATEVQVVQGGAAKRRIKVQQQATGWGEKGGECLGGVVRTGQTTAEGLQLIIKKTQEGEGDNAAAL